MRKNLRKVGCLIFYALPFGIVIWFSVTTVTGHSQSFTEIHNYIQILRNDVFRMAMGNTMKFPAVGLTLILVISYAIALFLKNRTENHPALQSVILLPYVMPVVGTVLLVDILFSQAGHCNLLLDAMGLPVQDWLLSDNAFWMVILLWHPDFMTTDYALTRGMEITAISDQQPQQMVDPHQHHCHRRNAPLASPTSGTV